MVYNPTLRLVKGSVLTWQELDANFTKLLGEFTAINNTVVALDGRIDLLEDQSLISYLPVAGGTLTGSLTLAGDPTSSLQAVTKQYLDTALLNLTLSSGSYNSVAFDADFANKSIDSLADVDTTGAIAGRVLKYDGTKWIASVDTDTDSYVTSVSFNSSTGVLNVNRSDNVTLTADLSMGFARTVNGILPDVNRNIAISITKTMTGLDVAKPATANTGVVYVVSGESNAELNGTAYIYVESVGWKTIKSFDSAMADSRYVNITGDTLNGPLVLSGNPTTELQAATKEYVDLNSGKTTTSASLNASTGVLTQTRSDNTTYTVNLFTGLDGRYVNTTGDTLTGPLLLASDPTTALQAATKQYVDTATSSIGAGTFLPLAGGSLTGFLTLHSDPTTALQAATKQYVDTKQAALGYTPVNKAGDNMTGALTVPSLTSTSTVSDIAGDLRDVPQNSKTAAYTLVLSDNGKHISTTSGVTVPASVFSVGDTVTIYNNSAASITITQGASVILRQVATTNTGNRTLAQRGLATILCVAANEFVITGGGLS
jgi:hypothetical protein